MSDSALLHDIFRTIGFVKQGVNALNRRANSERRPKDPGAKIRQIVTKTVAAAIVAKVHNIGTTEAEKRFRLDPEAAAAVRSGQLKAVTNPAMTTIPGWAAELVGSGPMAPFAAVAQSSLYGQLSRNPATLNISASNAWTAIPGWGNGPMSGGAFVSESQPIPVVERRTKGNSVLPQKFGVISTFSREIAQRTDNEIETIVADGLTKR